MQKFVVVKKSNEMQQEKTTQNQAKVEMSGYLKKKRNKVGGWRKMWFVLQNQLLLSYNSKEEYDKKLVCFKDVINLVPGTVVRPLGGFRFTIETTTDTIFTFRCDDNKSCTNWITALIESLSMQGQCAKENGLRIKPKLNASLENIRRPKRVVRTSYSWDSICQSSKNVANKLPKLPIAQNTAKILKRTGVDINKSAQHNHQNQMDVCQQRVRNFRLHDKHFLQSQEQSIEVSRINQMFFTQNHHHQNQNQNQNYEQRNSKNHNNHQRLLSSSTCSTTNNIAFNPLVTNTTTVSTLTTTTTTTATSNNKNSSCIASAALKTTNCCSTTSSGITNHSDVVATKTSTAIQQAKICNIKNINNCGNNGPVIGVKDKFYNYHHFHQHQHQKKLLCSNVNSQKSLLIAKTEIDDNKRKCKDNESLKNLNRNEMNEMCENSLEDQIQRLTLKDSSALMIDSTFLPNNSTNINNNNNNNNNIQKKSNGEAYAQHHHHHHQYQSKQKYNASDINIGVEEYIYHDNVNDEHKIDGDDSPMNDTVIVPHFSFNSTQDAHKITPTNTNEMKLFQSSKLSSSASSENVNNAMMSIMMMNGEHIEQVEPIYAVVDLKNKYARRAKLRELEGSSDGGSGITASSMFDDGVNVMQLEETIEQTTGNERGENNEIEQQGKKERPKSIHLVSSDYEEVLNFSNDCLDKDDEENENIYEPINIPEGSHHNHHNHRHHRHHHSRNAMWRYFPRINIEALIEMTRNRHKKDPKLVVEQHSPFSDIRRKFGNHRKSIKIKMKKFYSKESPVGGSSCSENGGITFKERNAFSDDELDSQGATGSNSGTSDNSIKSSCGNIEKSSASSYVFSEIEKYRRGEKQIFGSLSRLKKTTRKSLCLENDDDIDDEIACNGRNGETVGEKKFMVTPKSACFQHELRIDVSKRTGTKKTVCHSKFYD